MWQFFMQTTPSEPVILPDSVQRAHFVCKLIKRETRHFCNHVVKCRLKGCGRVCNLNFIQRHNILNFNT